VVGDPRRLQVHGVEEGVATVETEDGRLYEMPAWMLPAGARAGDRFDARVETVGGDAVRLQIQRDDEATARGRTGAAERLRRLTREDRGGDLDL
jgi:hypothetical protein